MRSILLVCLTLALVAVARADSTLNAGPLVGPAELTRASVWLQTSQPALVQLRYWPLAAPGDVRLSACLTTTAQGDMLANFVLGDLAPARRYGYEVYLDGRILKPGYPLEFQTLNPALTNFTFAVGSCCFVNDPERQDTYGGDYQIFQAVHRDRPDFMVWLGDNVYFRPFDWENEEGMRRRYRTDRHRLTQCWPLWGSTHHYAIWDDHDFGPNDGDSTFAHRDLALKVFRDYWPGSPYGSGRTAGIFYRFAWGDVEFFMLDDRYYRSPNHFTGSPKVMLGPVQMQWLKESLANSRATFKIVANGGQMLNPLCRFEGWGLFPEERQELLDYLRKSGISGVLFVSGDRHESELIRLQSQGLYPLYDLTSSPLTSTVSVDPEEANNPCRVPGTWVNTSRNYVLFGVDGEKGARVLHLSCKDSQGKVLWRYEIPQQELRLHKD